MASNPVLAAGFLVYRRCENQIQYLLLRHSGLRKHWTPPKGHVEKGEAEFETAIRETFEEAGLKKDHLEISDFKAILNYMRSNRPKKVTYWLAELKNPNTPIVLSREHTEYKWLPLDKACETAKFEDMQKALRNADIYLQSQL